MKLKTITEEVIKEYIKLQVYAKAGLLKLDGVIPRSKSDRWLFILARKMKVWIHKETEVLTGSPVCPCDGWYEVARMKSI